jgi:LuxR family transcriptional regulator, maltose regulon positive regulatory protein
MAAAAVVGLLKTKYSIPGSNKQLLTRQILNQRLDEALTCKLTILTAPAGYGKTTAVLKWLEGISLPSAWFSIDADDNDPVAFWNYSCAALSDINKDIGKDTAYVFSSQELFKANMHIRILIDHLSNAGSDFVFVIDDFHLIKNPKILEALAYFITYQPANMHLLILSRTNPRMKLTKLGLKENLLRLGAEDFLFHTNEIDQFFKARGFSLQHEELERIENYTEGWAAALVAVAISLNAKTRNHSVIAGFESCSQQIENYLVEDVISAWTIEQQDFMEKISLLDALCGPLCEAVTNYDGSRLLKELYEQNSFLIALDETNTWFRFHHLFRDFLREKLKKKDTAFVHELHRKAGAWFEANGFIGEAMEHFLKGAQYEESLVLMEKLWRQMTSCGEYSKLFSWIQRLPDKYSTDMPVVMLVESFCHVWREDYKKAWECIKKLEHYMKTNAPVSEALQKDYIVAIANLHLYKGDFDNLAPALKNAASISQDANIDYVDLNLYAISSYRANTNMFLKAIQNNPAKFELLAKDYRALIRIDSGYVPLIMGEYYYEHGKFNEALPKLAAAIDDATKADCPGALVPAMVTLAKIKRANGDIPGALGIVEECENRVEKFHRPHWRYLLNAFKVRLYLDAGNIEIADKWVEDGHLGLFHEITAVKEYELIVLARFLIAKQRYTDAFLLLNRLLSFAEAKKRIHSVVEITNLLAITALKDLDEEAAEKNIKKAISIGKEEGYVRSFVDELSPMIPLLELVIGKQKNTRLGSYVKKLLRLTKENAQHAYAPVKSDSAVNILTPVEKKVLQYILNACTNQEIADEMGITLSTVKAHTGSIYRKLEVKSRAQCIKNFREIFSLNMQP